MLAETVRILLLLPLAGALKVFDLVCRGLRRCVPFRFPMAAERSFNPGISVVIPEWDNAGLLEHCLESLASAGSEVAEPLEAIVVVNGSAPAVYSEVAVRHASVRWVYFPTPLGFSRAVAEGLKRARYDWVYLLNDDMVVDRDALKEAARWRAPRVFAIASQIFFQDRDRRREETNWTDYRVSDGAVEIFDMLPEDPPIARGSFYAGGGSSLFQKRVLERFIDRRHPYHPFYWEDVEWSMMAWKRGFEVIFCPASRVWHTHRATIAQHYAADEIDRIFVRNGYRFQLRNMTSIGLGWRLLRRLSKLDWRSFGGIAGPRFVPGMFAARARSWFAPFDESRLQGLRGRYYTEPATSSETQPQSPRQSAEAGPQTLAVKRAEVELHSYTCLGQPEVALASFEEKVRRRAWVIRRRMNFIGSLSPFVEIGANAGHTSYLLANEFGADGFAVDLSADALRYGTALMDRWRLERAPVRLASDAACLPFRDGTVRLVLAFQTLSQFMDIERVFLEVQRILAPGGVFLFSEEEMRRLLSLHVYRCPYPEVMKPWQRRLYDWGLLGYLVKDVVGAGQEEDFGIRQNHSLFLDDWHRLVEKHFTAHEYEIFVHQRGWGEQVVKRLAARWGPSLWTAARLLGGTLTAVCRKAGASVAQVEPFRRNEFQTYLRCPDCRSPLSRDRSDTLFCPACSFQAPNEAGVYKLLPSSERSELYPGNRADIIDFCVPGHEDRLLEGWHELEGVFGAKYRWMGPRASARLLRVKPGPQQLRMRGHAAPNSFLNGKRVKVEVAANGHPVGEMVLHHPGMFVLEADLPEGHEYNIEIFASPAWQAPPDRRLLTVNFGMIRLNAAYPHSSSIGP